MAESNNSLFTFSFKLVLFLGLLGVIVWVFLIPHAPDIGNDQKYVYALSKLEKNANSEKYDIAFFGNSYVFTGFDPTIFINELSLNPIHLNSGAQTLETSLVIAKDVIAKHHFKYIFFEVSGASLRKPEKSEDKFWYFQTIALQEIPFSFNKLKYLKDFFPIQEYKKNYVSALSKNTSRFMRLNEIEKYASQSKDTSFYTQQSLYYGYNGYLANNHSPISNEEFEKEFYREGYDGKEKLWTDEIITLLKEVIKDAKEQGTEVILMQSLKLYPTIYNDSLMQNIVKEFGNVKFLDLNKQRESYNLNASSFYNSTHLNYRGSYQITHRLVDSLSSWYKIPFKKKKELDFKVFKVKDFFYSLDGSQDKFVKFEFDSIPKVLQDHKFIVSLYPTDPNLLSETTKKNKFDSDNFSFDPKKDVIDVGFSKLFIKKLDTKITDQTLKKLMVYFYKANDTLKLSSYNINTIK